MNQGANLRVFQPTLREERANLNPDSRKSRVTNPKSDNLIAADLGGISHRALTVSPLLTYYLHLSGTFFLQPLSHLLNSNVCNV